MPGQVDPHGHLLRALQQASVAPCLGLKQPSVALLLLCPRNLLLYAVLINAAPSDLPCMLHLHCSCLQWGVHLGAVMHAGSEGPWSHLTSLTQEQRQLHEVRLWNLNMVDVTQHIHQIPYN